MRLLIGAYMDYEFRRNTFDDCFYADFSMGHEAIGRWLIDELGTDLSTILMVREKIAGIISEGGEWIHQGRVFQLQVMQDEAIVKANILFQNFDDEMEQEDLHAYEEESYACCGPEDLLAVVEAWQDFIVRFGQSRQPMRRHF